MEVTVYESGEHVIFFDWDFQLKQSRSWDARNLTQFSGTSKLDLFLCLLLSDDTRAIWDIWILGDEFLARTYNEFLAMKQKRNQNTHHLIC